MASKNRFFSATLFSLAAVSSVLLMTNPTVVRGESGIGMSGVPADWTHHRLVFSNPGTEEDAILSGTYDWWVGIVNDPRYVMQQLERQASLAAEVGRLSIVQNDWSMDLGSGGTVGAGQYPAKFSFGTSTASCANDFVVYNTGLAGSGTQPTTTAYNNLYSSCSGSVPSVYWQYNTAYSQGSVTGDGSKIATSIVLSLTGTQVAFVQNNSSNAASLVLLKWASNSSLVQMDIGSNNVAAGSYSTCTAPCMTRLTFSGSALDTNSAPFYDYTNDIIYVGDNSGKLHKFTPVFSGTPAEVTAGNWPITVSSNILTSPVYDSGTSKNIFVADSGGFLYSYTTAGAAVMKSSQLAASGSSGIVDAPLVDSTAEFVYVFVGDDENTATGFGCDHSTGCNGVFQFPAGNNTIGTGACTATSLTSWGTATNCGKESLFGVGIASTVIYDGSFDQIYFAGTGTTGNLWTCASNGNSGTSLPKLMRIGMSAFVPTGDVVGIATNVINPLTSAAGATCSPVTEVFGSGGSTDDYIFLSVTANGNVATCSGACLYNFVVSTNGTTTSVPSAPTAGLATTGGSSGIIIDNTSTTSGASQIYFSSLSNESCTGNGTTGSGTGGCAVQASQSAP